MPSTTIQNGKYTSFTLIGPFVGVPSSPDGSRGIGHGPPTNKVVVVSDAGQQTTFTLDNGQTVTLTPTGDLESEYVKKTPLD